MSKWPDEGATDRSLQPRRATVVTVLANARIIAGPPPSSPNVERGYIDGHCTRPGLAEVRVMRGDARCCCREVVALCVFTRGCVALSSSEPATSNCSSFFEGRKGSITRASRQAELSMVHFIPSDGIPWISMMGAFSSHHVGLQG